MELGGRNSHQLRRVLCSNLSFLFGVLMIDFFTKGEKQKKLIAYSK